MKPESWWRFFSILTITAYTVKSVIIVNQEEFYILYEEDDYPDGFHIPCAYTLEEGENTNDFQIEWTLEGIVVFSRTKRSGKWNNPNYGAGYTENDIEGPPHPFKNPDEVDLVIKNPARRYAGEWICKLNLLTGSPGSIVQYATEILIYYGPEFLFDPGNDPTSPEKIRSDSAYDQLKITCHAISFPPVQIMLFREDEYSVLPNGEGYYTGDYKTYGLDDEEKALEADFGNVSNLYRGEYVCLAVALSENYPKYPDGREARWVIDVDMHHIVVVKADDYGIVQAPVDHDEISLRCIVIEETLPSNFGWKFGGSSLPDDSTKYDFNVYTYERTGRYTEYELIIFDISTRDYGSYTCMFKNVVGDGYAVVELREGNAAVTPVTSGSSKSSPTLVAPLLLLVISYLMFSLN